MSLPDSSILDACAEVPSPFLLVDEAAVRRNIARMAALVKDTHVQLRPHFKAHKCPEIMQMQLDAPQTIGATCQTVAEAAVLAEMGCSDILLTSQLIDPRTAGALMQLPPSTHVAVLVDRPEQVDVIGRAAADRRSVTIFLEVDVGLGRGGFASDDPSVATTVSMIEQHPDLVLGGVQAYEGHAVLEPDADRRQQLATQAHRRGTAFRDRLSQVVGRRLRLTGGGTGTADLVASRGELDEIQCGSYVLMDAAYCRLQLPFEPALFCVATVLSAHPDGRVILDAGMKTTSGDGLPMSRLRGVDVLGMSDEHARAYQSTRQVSTGDRLLLQPWHVDPTMNLHRHVVMLGQGLRLRPTPIRGHHSLETWASARH